MAIVLPPIDSTHGLTLQEMLDHVSDELRDQNITVKIVRWLNMGLIELAYKYIFGPLHSNGTINTSPGIPDVTLATNFLLLKTVGIPSEQRKLWPVDEPVIAITDPDYRTLTGTTDGYYLNGNIMGLFNVPSVVKGIGYTYQRQPLKLTSLTQLCDLPAAWHSVIVQKAITKGYSYEGNREGKMESLVQEKSLLADLKPVLYQRPDSRSNLGATKSSGRLWAPRFPSNFPLV